MSVRLMDGVNPHDLDDRAAMGLPNRLVTRVPEDIAARHGDLASASVETLSTVVGEVSVPFTRRYFAGQLLALLGDPRIQSGSPELITVPGGIVSIGTTWETVGTVVEQWKHHGVRRDWITKECPRHTVEVPTFRMMRYPVTNLEYRRFLDDTGHWPAPSSWQFGVYPLERSNHPVWTVRSTDAEAYADWLSKRLGAQFRLPTEWEWEFAASGAHGQSYPWGEHFRAEAANTAEGGPLSTTPVGAYPSGRSPFGIDDLAGNVEELVANDYAPYPGGQTIADDLAASSELTYRVTRGGSFTRFGDLARCQRRHGWYKRDIYAIGFRLVQV